MKTFKLLPSLSLILTIPFWGCVNSKYTQTTTENDDLYYSSYDRTVKEKNTTSEDPDAILKPTYPPHEIPKPTSPPHLVIKYITFKDTDNNNILNANESSTINFTLSNQGKGEAYNLNVYITEQNNIQGLSYNKTKEPGNLPPGSAKEISVPVSSSMSLQTGQAKFRITITEANGFDAKPFEISIPTLEFQKPEVIVADHQFYSKEGGKIMLGVTVWLKVAIQNIGMGTAEDIELLFEIPENVYPAGEHKFNVGTLQPGEYRKIDFGFFPNTRYSDPENKLPITVKLTGKYGKYDNTKVVTVNIDQELSTSTTVTVKAKPIQKPTEIVSLTADVDKNIPFNSTKYPNRFALIIGNEDYQSRQKGLQSEQNVAFAKNDAQIFSQYCENTLGVLSGNITMLTDATAGEMSQNIELISKLISKIPGSELIFYYAGHGFPDENTKIPYLIPVDVNAGSLNSAIKLSDIYKNFSASGAKRVTVFLDACFTGGGRDAGLLLAARLPKIPPKKVVLAGNMVVFAASSGEQSALPYKEKQHGMFTYFLLKKLQNTKGDVTYSDLDDYIRKNVSVESLRINRKEQDPKVNVSSGVINEWGNWKLK